MDWLRRNWPDLLIGLALVAVIAGIVATLLTGGSFFPLGESTTSAGVERGTTQEQSTQSRAAAEDDGPAGDAPTRGAPAEAEGAGASAGAPGEASAPEGSADDGPDVAVLPTRDGEEDGASAAAPDDATQDEAAADPDGAEGRAAAQPLPVDEDASSPNDPASLADEDAASADEASTSPSEPNAGLPTDPFRVSVGAFSSSENAERQASRFREEGYPVFVGAQGELSIVLVGPYQERGRAEEVASEITEQHDDVDPVIYRYEPEGDAQEGATNIGTAQASAAAPTSETSEALEPSQPSEPSQPAEASAALAEATAGEAEASAAAESATAGAAESAAEPAVRLQVGAYATPDSAAPQVERLDGLGFHEVEQVRDGGLIRLMVGPYQGQALDDARALLDGAGIEYFPR